MEQRIKDRYTDAIQQEVMRRYAIEESQIGELDGFESFIYEFERNGRAYILRVSHSLRRSVNMIRGEIDLYAVIHRSFDVGNLEDHPWVARFMKGRRERIEGGVPFINFDFETLV